jgi:hypothetical protein
MANNIFINFFTSFPLLSSMNVTSQQVFLTLLTKDFQYYPKESVKQLLEVYKPTDRKCQHLYKECTRHFHIQQIQPQIDKNILEAAIKTRSSAFTSRVEPPTKTRLHSEVEEQTPNKVAKTDTTPTIPSRVQATLSAEQIQSLSKQAKMLARASQAKGNTPIVDLSELEHLKQVEDILLLELMLNQLELHTVSDPITILLCKMFLDTNVSLQHSRVFIYHILFKKVS